MLLVEGDDTMASGDVDASVMLSVIRDDLLLLCYLLLCSCVVFVLCKSIPKQSTMHWWLGASCVFRARKGAKGVLSLDRLTELYLFRRAFGGRCPLIVTQLTKNLRLPPASAFKEHRSRSCRVHHYPPCVSCRITYSSYQIIGSDRHADRSRSLTY